MSYKIQDIRQVTDDGAITYSNEKKENPELLKK